MVHTNYQKIYPCDGYVLQDIKDISYLLPYGQRIVEFRHGIRLNETGKFIWNTIRDGINYETLLTKILRHYNIATETDATFIQQDLDEFLEQMEQLGYLHRYFATPTRTINFQVTIANLSIHLRNQPEELRTYFQNFIVESAYADVTKNKMITPDNFDTTNEWLQTQPESDMTITTFYTDVYPSDIPTGNLLLQSGELTVYEREEDYYFLLPASSHILAATLSKDGKHACIYCKVEKQHYATDTRKLANQLFYCVRFLFSYTAQLHGIFALHSASILYRGKAWLFTGPSGTGKSTHTNLWHSLFNTYRINGDYNLITMTHHDTHEESDTDTRPLYSEPIPNCDDANIIISKPVIMGSPWCGTSGIYDNKTYSLGGIILLEQASSEQLLTLLEHEKILQVAHRFLSPTWSSELLQKNITFATKLSSQIFIHKLECTKNDNAAIVMKEAIDMYLENQLST